MSLLAIRDLSIAFGGLHAVNALTLDVVEGSIHSLIGPNGAGKTSVINAITGLYPAVGGSIRFRDEEILGLPPHRISGRGITRTFQNVELFPEMSVLDNVLVGAHLRINYGIFGATFRIGPRWRHERREIERGREILKMLGLDEDGKRAAQDLTLGKQRRLELARALATGPQLVLLDEPGAGMTAAEVKELNRVLIQLKEYEKITILLVDHVMQLVMEISDTITVLHYGEKIAEGLPRQVQTDARVVRAYLGERRSRAFA